MTHQESMSGRPNPDLSKPVLLQKIMLAVAAIGTLTLFGAIFFLFA